MVVREYLCSFKNILWLDPIITHCDVVSVEFLARILLNFMDLWMNLSFLRNYHIVLRILFIMDSYYKLTLALSTFGGYTENAMVLQC